MIQFLLLGILLVVLGIPLMLRKVPPNRWYGIRLRETLSDEDVWYEANAATGRDMLVAGVAQVIAALFAGELANILVLAAGAILVAGVGIRRAKQIASGRV